MRNSDQKEGQSERVVTDSEGLVLKHLSVSKVILEGYDKHASKFLIIQILFSFYFL